MCILSQYYVLYDSIIYFVLPQCLLIGNVGSFYSTTELYCPAFFSFLSVANPNLFWPLKPQQRSSMEIEFHPPTRSTFDRRGVKRYGCTEDCKDRCSQFEVCATDNICSYCRCPTTKHSMVDGECFSFLICNSIS